METKILTFGVFDFFHLGHLRLFKQARQHGDYLIVAVQKEEYVLKYKPDAHMLYTTEERMELISSLKIVDEVVPYESVCTGFLQEQEFDILALGEDHVGGRFDECRKWCEENGKKVVRLKRTQGIDSTRIKSMLKRQ